MRWFRHRRRRRWPPLLLEGPDPESLRPEDRAKFFAALADINSYYDMLMKQRLWLIRQTYAMVFIVCFELSLYLLSGRWQSELISMAGIGLLVSMNDMGVKRWDEDWKEFQQLFKGE